MEKLTFGDLKDNVKINIDKLSLLFPNVVSETKNSQGVPERTVNFNLLKQMLSYRQTDNNETYEFTWIGKNASIVKANVPTEKTLHPLKDISKNWNTTNNIYIQGDNLDVLKLLKLSCYSKIKMIYIDPPYNTGKDFIYNDNFAMAQDEYEEKSGLVNEDKNRNFAENNRSNPRFHSDWCSMIYPRLLIARDLLSEDGAIFISIDDTEQDNLKKICNEIFGESNFVAQFVWQTKGEAKGIPPLNMCIQNHEYILVYSKSPAFSFRGVKRNVKDGFTNPDHDPRGPWKRQYVQRFGQGFPTRTIVNPENGMIFSFESPYTEEKLNSWIKDNRIIFPVTSDKYPAKKEFFSEYKSPYKPTLTNLGLYSTKVASEKLKKLFGSTKVFDYSKPIELIKDLIRMTTNKEDIVMDFFSGSATTAQALMEINAQDQGQRSFILVQMPEKCSPKSSANKLGYKDIFALGRDRILRSGIKIQNSLNKENLCDIGFRAFKLGEANVNSCYYPINEYSQELLQNLKSTIKSNCSELELFFDCILKLGLPLTIPYIKSKCCGFTVYKYCLKSLNQSKLNNKAILKAKDNKDNIYHIIACFAENISEKAIMNIAKLKPKTAIFRDLSFVSAKDKINAIEIFKKYSPGTKLKML